MAAFPLPLNTHPMEARLVEQLPADEGWQYEPKWDGFRCLVFRSGKDIDLRAKSGKPLARYFPDIVERAGAMAAKTYVLDGEIVIAVGGKTSFELLQMRLHPAASRVAKLAQEQPAQLVLFDCLADPAGPALDAPLAERQAALEALYRETEFLRLSPYARDRRTAQKWLKRSGRALDGVIAKRLDGSYLAGERAMLKVKPRRTADCVVGGFRYGAGARRVGSLLLGLYDDKGLLHHVGFTSSISQADPIM